MIWIFAIWKISMAKKVNHKEQNISKSDAPPADIPGMTRAPDANLPAETPAPPPAEHIPGPAPEAGAVIEAEKQKEKEKPEGRTFLKEAADTIKRKRKPKKPQKQAPAPIPAVRDELTLEIENIMEEGLADAYKELSVVEQQEFKLKGEETAQKIREILKSTRIKVKKIFRLLFEWLKLLPGVNRFFLEQEAKIRADKIAALKNIHRDKQ